MALMNLIVALGMMHSPCCLAAPATGRPRTNALYCLRIEPITGTRIGTIECRTRDDGRSSRSMSTRSGQRTASASWPKRPTARQPLRRWRGQPLVIRPAAVGEAPRVVGKFDRMGLRRAEAGAFLDRAVPVRRPRAVGFATAGLPAEHRRVPRNPERVAQRRQHAFGIGKHVIGVDRPAAHGRAGRPRVRRIRPADRARNPRTPRLPACADRRRSFAPARGSGRRG